MSDQRNLLWISPFFPPAEGVGGLRVGSFVRHLETHGYASRVVTRALSAGTVPASHGVYVDPWLRPLWLRVSGRLPRGSAGRKLFQLKWGSTFSGAWIGAAVRASRSVIFGERPQAIISSGPPFSAHEIAWRIRGETGIPWIMDMRDPWFPEADETADRFRQQCQSRWFKDAAAVVATTPEILAMIRQQGLPERTAGFVVPNGYDAEECPRLDTPWPTKKFSVVYTGNLYGPRRLDTLLNALSGLVRENKVGVADIEVIVLGTYDQPHVPENIRSACQFHRAVPRKDLATTWKQATLLCVIQPREYAPCVPTKLYEHLSIGRPILALVPLGSPSARLVEEFHAGRVAALEDEGAIRNVLMDFYRAWKSGTLNMPKPDPDLQRCERSHLAFEFEKILNQYF